MYVAARFRSLPTLSLNAVEKESNAFLGCPQSILLLGLSPAYELLRSKDTYVSRETLRARLHGTSTIDNLRVARQGFTFHVRRKTRRLERMRAGYLYKRGVHEVQARCPPKCGTAARPAIHSSFNGRASLYVSQAVGTCAGRGRALTRDRALFLAELYEFPSIDLLCLKFIVVCV